MSIQITTEEFIQRLNGLLSSLAQSDAKIVVTSIQIDWAHEAFKSSHVVGINLDIQKRVG